MRSKFAVTIVLLCIFAFVSCGDFFNPSGPSGISAEALTSWRPCVTVQNPGFRGTPEFEIQMQAVEKLQRAGSLKYMRLGGTDMRGVGLDYAVEAKRLGLQTIGIIRLADLELNPQGWENTYDQYKNIYGNSVDVWQIGGEVKNADPSVNLVKMEPKLYILKFKRLFEHIRQRYPEDIVTNAPTFGSHPGAREEFEKFIEAGLLEIEPDSNSNLIIAVHIYTSDALEDYGKVFNRYSSQLIRKTIWVTETGVNDPSQHVNWVTGFYANIISTLHPQLICWYVLYGGEGLSDHGGHGLITNVSNGLPLEERELFIRLTGGQR